MTISLSENLKKLRTERQLTQEQLSELLGVSPQTVSRWEIGKVSPDISLLPVIAAYFNISVDDLLGVDTARKEEKIRALLKEKLRLQNNGELEKSVELLRQGISDYPNEPRLLYSLAVSLYGLYFMSRAEFTETQKKNAALENIDLLKKAQRYADENFEDCGGIRQMLVLNYIESGEHEKAREAALKAPFIGACRENLLCLTFTGKEAAEQNQKNLLHFTNEAYNSIWRLRDQGEHTDEQIIEISVMAEKLLLLIGGEHSGFVSLFSNALEFLKIYIKTGNREKTLEYLEKAFQYASDSEERPDMTKYDVPWLCYCENNSKQRIKHSADSLYAGLYDFISKRNLSGMFKGDKRFASILEKIQAHIQ